MPLKPGARLGPYEIVSAVGAGGMGEVYRARDTRLGRDVAIKVLPASVSADPDRLRRFDLEARAAAALNCPNILAVYDIGSHDGTPYIVSELLEGETLRARLARSPARRSDTPIPAGSPAAEAPAPANGLTLRRTIEFAVQIAHGLAAAHGRGIVHRDLKPDNIFITTDGHLKILDFGLAKLTEVDTALADVSQLATKAPDSVPGLVLGTMGYMAPEQLRGQTVDHRADVFAFGAIVYEMLSGQRAFSGATAADVISATIEKEPAELCSPERHIPLALGRLVERCLEKNPAERFQSTIDLAFALESLDTHAAAHPAATPPVLPTQRDRVWRMAAGVLLLSVVLLAAVSVLYVRGTASAPVTSDVVRLSILPPEKTQFTGPRVATVGVPQLALSPDGRAIVFAAAAPGARPTLWLRWLDTVTAHPLTGTEGAESPFWSPDNQWIGYFAEGKLKKIPSSGGFSQLIANVPDNRQASWGPDGTILFGRGTTGILRVSSSSGTPAPVTELDNSREEGSHRFPQFLPDGRHFLFTIRSSRADVTGVYAGSLDGKTKKLLLHGNTSGLYASSGHLLFVDGDTLMGQAFDPEQLELRGQAFVVDGGVGRSSLGTGSFSVSGTGRLAHAGAISTPGVLRWFDRSGALSDAVVSPGDYTDFRLSTEQTRLAASLVDPKTGFPQIWITDLTRGGSTAFTFGPGLSSTPVWASNDSRIIFRTTRAGGLTEFYANTTGGGGKEEVVLSQTVARASGALSANMILWDWSPDRQHLLFSATTSSDDDLWLVPLTGGSKPVNYLSAPGDQWHGNFSHDGKLVAYSSDESGHFEVYVQTFPRTERQWPVSTTGGFEPRWRADGREIYYLSADQKLMAVTVGPGPSFGTPTPLFPVRIAGGVSSQRTHYVPSSDGKRFLINTPTSDAAIVPITVVLNWQAALKK